jgi:ABC-type transporter MlaC component
MSDFVTISFQPEEPLVVNLSTEVLSSFKKSRDNKKEIQVGMSPQMIAEIVSEHLISVVKGDFAAQDSVTKKESQS